MPDDNKENEHNIVQPQLSSSENFKLFCRVLSRTDSDDLIFDNAQSAFSGELRFLEREGRDFLEVVGEKAKNLFSSSKEKAFEPDYLNRTNSLPTLTNESVEHQMKRKSNTAADALFRPELRTVEKKSQFFNDVKYDVSLDKFYTRKKISPTLEGGTVIDYFDKSVGLQFQHKSMSQRTSFKGAVEYEPFDNTLKISGRYREPDSTIDGKFYLNEGNPGVSAGYSKQLSPKARFRVGASFFKSDAAFDIDYKTKLKDNSHLSIGAYGSTYYKEAGIKGKWNFYTR